MGTQKQKKCAKSQRNDEALFPPLLEARAQTSIFPRGLTPRAAHRLDGDGAMWRLELYLVLTQAERRTRCSCTSLGSGALCARPSPCLFFRLRAATRFKPPPPRRLTKNVNIWRTHAQFLSVLYMYLLTHKRKVTLRHRSKRKISVESFSLLLLKCK